MEVPAFAPIVRAPLEQEHVAVKVRIASHATDITIEGEGFGKTDVDAYRG
jgi:hypothetical protein